MIIQLLFVIAALILVAGDVVGIVLFDAVTIAIMLCSLVESVFPTSAFFAAIYTQVCNFNLFPSSLLIFTIYLLCIAVAFAAVTVWFLSIHLEQFSAWMGIFFFSLSL